MKIMFLGDLCVSSEALPVISNKAIELFGSAEIVFVNLEAPIIKERVCAASKVGPVIHQTEMAMQLVSSCSVTHLNLANNHIMDYGSTGLQKTLDILGKLQHIGAGMSHDEAYCPSWYEHNGQRIAFLAFGEAQFGALHDNPVDQVGFAWIDSPHARQSVIDVRKSADWVIVQVHAGLEMVDIPLPEWRTRYRELIDLGADIVIGHHPHVLQGAECYKGKMIYYSLGNFYMDVMLQQADPGSGGALEVQIEDGRLSSRMIPLFVTRELIDIDESEEAFVCYRTLCEKLSNEHAYYKQIQDICDAYWCDIYSKYYESAVTGLGAKPNYRAARLLFRRIIARFIRGRWNSKENELMLIHNIRIETHRWVVERALLKRALQ
jgi:poly-gamma-glutamate synthesis protein (capsule biosynthesis protein)